MLNAFIFIFIIYAMSYSVKAILFSESKKKRRKAYSRTSAQRTKHYAPGRKSPQNYIKTKPIITAKRGCCKCNSPVCLCYS